jgi:hypothetical protein
MSIKGDEAMVRKNEAIVKTQFPAMNILVCPHISANFPQGTRNMPADRVKARATQLKETAGMFRSLPIEGSATFTAERAKGMRKDPIVVTINTGLSPLAFSGFFMFSSFSCF